MALHMVWGAIGFVLFLLDYVRVCLCMYIFFSIILVIFNLLFKKYLQAIVSSLIALSLLFYLFVIL